MNIAVRVSVPVGSREKGATVVELLLVGVGETSAGAFTDFVGLAGKETVGLDCKVEGGTSGLLTGADGLCCAPVPVAEPVPVADVGCVARVVCVEPVAPVAVGTEE